MYAVATLKSYFEEYLNENLYKKEPKGLYDPINYILEIGGKRLRPILVLAAYNLYYDDLTKAFKAALATEIFHNFTLLHDDIMDEAPLRRGEATVHEKYDTNTAILSGDLMSILSFQLLNEIECHNRPHLIEIFSLTATRVCEGQQLDMDFETEEEVSIDDYLQMIQGKTAALMGGALALGAITADCDSQDEKHLYEFGNNLGICFQIKDDILDTYGETHKVGKQKGGDIIQGKKTYLYIKTLQLLEGEQKKEFKQIYATPNENSAQKIDNVLYYFNEVNAKGYAEELIEVYRQLAQSHLDAVKVDTKRKEILNNFAEKLSTRVT